MRREEREQSAALRLSADRIVFYGVGLTVIGLLQVRFAGSMGQYWDWPIFQRSGALAGTPALLPYGFVYMPGAAWLFVPAAHLSLPVGFLVNAAMMGCAAVLAGALAARVYGLALPLSVLAAQAWAPVTGAIVVGQNAPIGLLLTVVAIFALVRRRSALAGLAVGLLLYKPTYALPYLVLLVARREWRALAVVALAGVAWYVASIGATGGDVAWPVHYLQTLHGYVGRDFAGNADKALSLPGLLLRLGVPFWAAALAGVALLLSAMPLFARATTIEAASYAGLIGLAASPHAWPYDATLALPAVLYVMASAAEPWRTRLVVSAYLVSTGWLLVHVLRFDPIALFAIGGTALVFARWTRGLPRGTRDALARSPM